MLLGSGPQQNNFVLFILILFTVGYRTSYITANETTLIAVPLNPSNYPYGIDITWNIHTDEDRKILISFSSFITEYRQEYLRVGDGNDSSASTDMFFKWSGHIRKPPKLLSSGNAMWLRFASISFFSDGFSLSASSVLLNGMRRVLSFTLLHLT